MVLKENKRFAFLDIDLKLFIKTQKAQTKTMTLSPFLPKRYRLKINLAQEKNIGMLTLA